MKQPVITKRIYNRGMFDVRPFDPICVYVDIDPNPHTYSLSMNLNKCKEDVTIDWGDGERSEPPLSYSDLRHKYTGRVQSRTLSIRFNKPINPKLTFDREHTIGLLKLSKNITDASGMFSRMEPQFTYISDKAFKDCVNL